MWIFHHQSKSLHQSGVVLELLGYLFAELLLILKVDPLKHKAAISGLISPDLLPKLRRWSCKRCILCLLYKAAVNVNAITGFCAHAFIVPRQKHDLALEGNGVVAALLMIKFLPPEPLRHFICRSVGSWATSESLCDTITSREANLTARAGCSDQRGGLEPSLLVRCWSFKGADGVFLLPKVSNTTHSKSFLLKSRETARQ